MVRPLEQRVESLASDLIRLTLILTLGTDLGIIHTCPMKEVAIRRSRLQCGDRNARLFACREEESRLGVALGSA